LDIAVETIRMYEREGLLLPHKTASGQRLFNESDIHWISCIRRLIKEKGLNLEGIRRLLALIPCWELRPCSEEERKNCTAYWDETRPCWMMKADVSENCRIFNCRDCQVYQVASRCDNLKTLLRLNKI
jgi:MerR family transcriptional regulator/heat shock protein HspR